MLISTVLAIVLTLFYISALVVRFLHNDAYLGPSGIRFAQSKVRITWVYVPQSHVSSFGVKFQELMMVWYILRPNSGTLVGSSVSLVMGFWV